MRQTFEKPLKTTIHTGIIFIKRKDKCHQHPSAKLMTYCKKTTTCIRAAKGTSLHFTSVVGQSNPVTRVGNIMRFGS